MWNMIKDHPVFSIIGAITAVTGIVIGVLSLTEAKYPLVTDPDICGYTEETENVRLHQWNECENPNKITGYRFRETVSQSSGRVGGGKDQNWHCTNVKRDKEAAVGQSIVWSNQRSSEESDKSLTGRATYKYHCTIDAKWGPIYTIERWEGCGEAPLVTRSTKKPKTCYDETKRIGWKWKWE